MTISRAQIPESIDMQEGGDPAEKNKLLEDYIADLQKREDEFDFSTRQQKYAEQLQTLVPPQDDFDIFDLASAISRGLVAQQQGQGPDSIGEGLAMGFNLASEDMQTKKQALAKARQEIALQSAKMAMEDEKSALDYLDKASFELAKVSIGDDNTKTADIRNYEYRQKLDDDGKKAWDKMKNQDPLALYLLKEAERKAGSPGGLDLTVGEKALDEEFSKIAAEYTLKGGPQVAINLKNLGEKIKILEEGELNVSGPLVGSLGDTLQAFFFPDAASFQSDIRDVVFQSLREKLGAQFTEREGDRLVAAAFNNLLDESRNVARLKRLYTTIEQAAQQKQEAIDYFNENGTIKGLSQPVLDFDTLMDDMIQNTDYGAMSDEELEDYFEKADPKERQIILDIIAERE